MTSEGLKKQAEKFFSEHKSVKCPAFSGGKVIFNSKGLSHLFYKGSQKIFARSHDETKVRVSLLARALEVLKVMPLAQEESVFVVHGKKVRYWAFEAVINDRRVKVVVRQVGNGKKHFWSVIPAWRRTRGQVTNSKGNLSKQ